MARGRPRPLTSCVVPRARSFRIDTSVSTHSRPDGSKPRRVPPVLLPELAERPRRLREECLRDNRGVTVEAFRDCLQGRRPRKEVVLRSRRRLEPIPRALESGDRFQDHLVQFHLLRPLEQVPPVRVLRGELPDEGPGPILREGMHRSVVERGGRGLELDRKSEDGAERREFGTCNIHPDHSHRVMTTLLSVKNRIASRPWGWRSPKKESFVPLNGKYAIGAATPMLIPTFPARTRYPNSRAAFPLDV